MTAVSEPSEVADDRSASSSASTGSTGSSGSSDVQTETQAQAAAAAQEDARQREAKSRDQRDRRLVRRIRQGDDRAFQELVIAYQDRIYGLTYRMLGNRQEAEDVAQEIFISVHRAIGTWRGEGRFYTWLYRVASNHCKNRIKYLKGRNFHRASDIDETPAAHLAGEDGGPVNSLQSQVPGPEQAIEGRRLEEIIQIELANLDEEHRLLIVLRDVQGMTYQDIIRVTGLQEGTLKSRLHRARVALKKRVTPYLK